MFTECSGTKNQKAKNKEKYTEVPLKTKITKQTKNTELFQSRESAPAQLTKNREMG